MYRVNKFNSHNSIPNEEQIETWVEKYFFSLFSLFTAFFSKVEAKEAVLRMNSIPFDKLLKKELEGESEEVVEIALKKLQDLVETEMQVLKAYVE